MDYLEIKQVIEEYSGLDLTISTNKAEYVHNRWMYWSLAIKYLRTPIDVLGESVNRSHCSVVHGVSRARDVDDESRLDLLLKQNQHLRDSFNLYESHIKEVILNPLLGNLSVFKKIFDLEVTRVRLEMKTNDDGYRKIRHDDFAELGEGKLKEEFIETRLKPFLKSRLGNLKKIA